VICIVVNTIASSGKKTKGMFIIATNDIRKQMSREEMLELYKLQQNVERGF